MSVSTAPIVTTPPRHAARKIAPAAGDLLLGQSFLRRFQSWSIDNGRGVLVLD